MNIYLVPLLSIFTVTVIDCFPRHLITYRGLDRRLKRQVLNADAFAAEHARVIDILTQGQGNPFNIDLGNHVLQAPDRISHVVPSDNTRIFSPLDVIANAPIHPGGNPFVNFETTPKPKPTIPPPMHAISPPDDAPFGETADDGPPAGGGVAPADDAEPVGHGIASPDDAPPVGRGTAPADDAPPLSHGATPSDDAPPFGHGAAPADDAGYLGRGTAYADDAPPVGHGTAYADDAPPVGRGTAYADDAATADDAPPVGLGTRPADDAPPAYNVAHHNAIMAITNNVDDGPA